MQTLTLLGLVGAICLGANGHFFTYDDSDNTHHFRPSFYVSKTPPKPGHRVGHHQRSHYTPSYYISKTLPRWPNKPHGTGAVYDYPAAPSYRNSYHGSYRALDSMAYRGLDSMESLEYNPLIIRQGRSKKKGYQPIKGGWWYQWKNGKLYTGRWGAPPPPGLEKEHYIYGGGQGWGQSYHSQGGGHGYGHGHGGHHGHRGHGYGGHGHGGHGHGHGSHHTAFPHAHGPVKHNHGHYGIGPGGAYGYGGGWGWGGGKSNSWGY